MAGFSSSKKTSFKRDPNFSTRDPKSWNRSRQLQAVAPTSSGPSRSSKPKEAHDESNWLVSYADMMTLLCGFFILLFSFANIDEKKYESVKEEVSKQFGGKYEPPAAKERAEEFQKTITQMGLQDKADVTYDPLGVSVAFQSTIFFETLSADVSTDGKDVLLKIIQMVRERQTLEKKEFKIVVEGHTDSRPVLSGTFASNWELSGSRSARVVRLFIEQGFTPTFLASMGFADTRPVVESKLPSGDWNESALSKNRRVVIRILDPKVETVPFSEAAPAKPAG